MDDPLPELGMTKLWPRVNLPLFSVSKEGLKEAQVFLFPLASGRDFSDWWWLLLDSTEAWSVGDVEASGVPPLLHALSQFGWGETDGVKKKIEWGLRPPLCDLAETLASIGLGVMPITKVENEKSPEAQSPHRPLVVRPVIMMMK